MAFEIKQLAVPISGVKCQSRESLDKDSCRYSKEKGAWGKIISLLIGPFFKRYWLRC